MKWLGQCHAVGNRLKLGFKFLFAWPQNLCSTLPLTSHCQSTEIPLAFTHSPEPAELAEYIYGFWRVHAGTCALSLSLSLGQI